MHAHIHTHTHTHTHTHMFRFWLPLPSGWCSALTLSLCGVTQASMAGMSEDEYKKRVNFLKQQRDKLMEMKRKEREKQLLSAASDQPARPASARAARNALRQPEAPAEPAAPSEEEKKLAMRKAIANRIKSELMGKKWAVLLQCSFHPFTSSWPSSSAWFQMHLHLIWVWCLCVFSFLFWKTQSALTCEDWKPFYPAVQWIGYNCMEGKWLHCGTAQYKLYKN